MSRPRRMSSLLSIALVGFLSPSAAAPQTFGGHDLIGAAKDGRIDEIRTLLAGDPGAVDVPDEAGYTPLRWAGIRGFTAVARTLMEAGAVPTEEGVGCEACHGPGSAYMSPYVMTNPEAFLADGGQVPNELTCRGCHRDEAFVFSEWRARIRHWR